MSCEVKPDGQRIVTYTGQLEEGLALSVIDCGSEEGGFWKVGVMGIKSITVKTQPGQMGLVPWAEVTTGEGEPILVNLSLIQSVKIA